MKEYNLLLDFVDGKLDFKQEGRLFAKLSKDSTLRSHLKQFISLDRSSFVNAEDTMPSKESTHALFGSLGFDYPANIEAPAPFQNILSRSWEYYKFNSRVIGGCAISSIITALITFFVLSNNSNSGLSLKNIKSNGFRTSVSAEKLITQNKSIKNEKINLSGQIKEKENKYRYIKAYNDLSNEDKPVELPVNSIINQPKQLNIEPLNIESNNNIFDFNRYYGIKNLTVNNSKIYYPGLINDNLFAAETYVNEDPDWSLEYRGATYFTLPAATILPSYKAMFQNSSITCLRKISIDFSIGFDIRQEMFFLIYTGMEGMNKEFRYEQQPNYTTLSGIIRFDRNLINKLDLLGQASLGGNYFGAVCRIGAGIEFSPYNDVSFILMPEYSNLLFKYQGKLFNASKIGICYGFSYKF